MHILIAQLANFGSTSMCCTPTDDQPSVSATLLSTIFSLNWLIILHLPLSIAPFQSSAQNSCRLMHGPHLAASVVIETIRVLLLLQWGVAWLGSGANMFFFFLEKYPFISYEQLLQKKLTYHQATIDLVHSSLGPIPQG